MRQFQTGDIVKELNEFTLGEVTKVNYNNSSDEVYVTFDSFLIEHCYDPKHLQLVAQVEDRKDKQ